MSSSNRLSVILILCSLIFDAQAHSFVTCGMIAFTPKWNTTDPYQDIKCIGAARLFPNISQKTGPAPTYYPTKLDQKGQWYWDTDTRPGGASIYQLRKKTAPLVHPGQDAPVYYDDAPMGVVETGSKTMGMYRTNGHAIFYNTTLMNMTYEERSGFWSVYYSGKAGLSLRNVTQLDSKYRIGFGGFSASTLMKERVNKVNKTIVAKAFTEASVGIFTMDLKDPTTKADLVPGRYQFVWVWSWGPNDTIAGHWTTAFDLMVVPKGYSNGQFQAPLVPQNLTSYMYKGEVDWTSSKYNTILNPAPEAPIFMDTDQGKLSVPPPKTPLDLQIAQIDNGTAFPNLTHAQEKPWFRPPYFCANGTMLSPLTEADIVKTGDGAISIVSLAINTASSGAGTTSQTLMSAVSLSTQKPSGISTASANFTSAGWQLPLLPHALAAYAVVLAVIN